MTGFPPLPHPAWAPTLATLHRWLQIVGKIRVAQTPWLNHSWHVPLYLTARGLTTSPIPYGTRTFQIDLDVVAHELRLYTDDGASETLALQPMSVADFWTHMHRMLSAARIDCTINPHPNEIADATPFPEDTAHASYDRDHVTALWRALLASDRVFKRFQTGFLGKQSPVHFFWGSFDLAVTRFSGRRAPMHPGGFPALPDTVTREAYSHEVASAGFWPGGADGEAMYFAYAYPEPPGFRTTALKPAAARWHEQLSEFVLPYEAVRSAADPERALMDFLQSAYEAAADAADWDRDALDCPIGQPQTPRSISPPRSEA